MKNEKLLKIVYNSIITMEAHEYEHDAILQYLEINESEYDYIIKEGSIL